jgi:glycosidase
MRRTADRPEMSADAIFYQVYVRSFADANGDGIGDLEGIRSRLGYLELLDINGLWLIPHHPLTDDLTAFDQLIADAHDRGFKVVLEAEAAGDDTMRFWVDHGVDGFSAASSDPGVLAAPRNTALVDAAFDADAVRRAIEKSLDTESTWALSSHEAARHVTRYGGGAPGHQRARAMALVMLALPGIVCLYNGEELGLPDVDLPEWASGDRCRVPLPWEGSEPPFGFTTGQPWLPMPNEWAAFTVEAQLEDPESMLSLYRLAVELRKTHSALRGGTLEWYGAPAGCFAFRRKEGGLICALNTGSAPVPLPPGELLLSSAPLVDDQLPPDTTAWLV